MLIQYISKPLLIHLSPSHISGESKEDQQCFAGHAHPLGVEDSLPVAIILDSLMSSSRSISCHNWLEYVPSKTKHAIKA